MTTSTTTSSFREEHVDDSTTIMTTETRSIFLTPDERYEVFMVKMAERPHLLSREKGRTSVNEICPYNNDNDNNDDQNHDQDEMDEDNDEPPPLIDGCDIPGWRYYGMIPTSHVQECVLGIGSGSSLFRTESQLPIAAPSSTVVTNSVEFNQQQQTYQQASSRNAWQVLLQKLLVPPSPQFSAGCIDIQQASEHVSYPHTTTLPAARSTTTTTTTTRFSATWEVANRPCVVTGCCETEHWNMESLSFDSLVDRFGDLNWRFSDTHGAVMSLDTYAKYVASLEGGHDDSPLAIYDSEFGDANSPTRVLTEDYQVPSCFSPDLFDLATTSSGRLGDDDGTCCDADSADSSQTINVVISHDVASQQPSSSGTSPCHCRPPYRWILMGPARSGTGMHIDPIHTNAWVTVVQGLKRWMLFPSDTPPDLIGMQDPPLPSVIWFRDFFDKVNREDWPQQYKPVQVLQRPGDTVFVPNGWPHVVVNLDESCMTVAVTHNYASEFGPHFDTMVQQTRDDEPEFYKSWLLGLKQHRPDLYQRIQEIEEDDFEEQQQETQPDSCQ